MIIFAGCGSLGSHIAMTLAPLVKYEFYLIDDDRVGKENITTSIYGIDDIGEFKVRQLEGLLWAKCEKRVDTTRRTIKAGERFIGGVRDKLLIDTFDNPASRQLTICDIPTVHIGVGEGEVGSIVWDVSYQSPTLDFKRGENPVCFTPDTLILTHDGYVPIERISIGDLVLTHKNRWMPVTEIMETESSTVIVKGHGNCVGIETTESHPFLCKERTGRHRPEIDGKKLSLYRFSEEKWKHAGELSKNDFWATPATIPALPIPVVSGRGFDFSNDFWWFVGLWLAEGVLVKKANTILLYCNHNEVDYISDRLSVFFPNHGGNSKKSELKYKVYKGKTASRFCLYHRGLVEWLYNNFGSTAKMKRIPGWVYGLSVEEKKALLDGYLYGDGYIEHKDRVHVRHTYQTVSKQLAFGVKTLLATLGILGGLYDVTPSKNTILGRSVNISKAYKCGWSNSPVLKWADYSEQHLWSRVYSVTKKDEVKRVYNLSVAGDESYVADGIIVHNCTNELGFYIINITATIAVKSILQYLQEGVKVNYYINGLNIKGVKND